MAVTHAAFYENSFPLSNLQVSRLVVSEIVSRGNITERVACIEKWAAIADICRCMHNFNGVLQICAAFVNSSVYRLKKTWEKLSKQVNAFVTNYVIERFTCPQAIAYRLEAKHAL